MDKKFLSVDKSMFEVKEGKVYIKSEELANAIQNQDLDLFVDEEAAGAAELADLFGSCQGICS